MRHPTFALLIVLVAWSAAFADEAEDRANYLYTQFMPPCCFTGLLKDHQSGSADEMKAQILQFVRQGKTDQEIKDFYVAQYGERILSQPVEEGFNRLAVVAPVAIFLIGFVVVGVILRGKKRKPVKHEAPDRDGLDQDVEDEIDREIREGM